MLACQNNQVEIVKLLVSRGADIMVKSAHERTALDLAMDGGYDEIVRILRIQM